MTEIKYDRFIASFLIALVTTLPFYTADVYASTVLEVTVTNKDSVSGFVEDKDTLTFTVRALIDEAPPFTEADPSGSDEPVEPNDVWLQFLNAEPGAPFISCTGSGPYTCTKAVEEDSFSAFTISPVFPYMARLFKSADIPSDGSAPDSDDALDLKTGKIFLDNLNPVITSFQTQSNLFNQGNIEFQYTIQDTACTDVECSGKCSGIKKIEFSSSPGFTGSGFQETVDIDTDSCTVANSLIKPIGTFQEGGNAVYARAFDRLGNPSDVTSAIFTVDTAAPVILTNTLKIADSANLEISFVAPNNIDITAKVDIEASDLDKDSVFGNFSKLAPNQENVKASCGDTIDTVTACTWSSLKINTNEPGSKNIVLEASDLTGNRKVAAIPKNFDLDVKGPEVKSLRSSKTKDGKSYIKNSGNSFTAEFTENVGIRKEDALLHVGDNAIQATNCTLSSVCTWQNVDVSGSGTIEISIQEDTKDRLGNSVAQEFSIEAVVDTEAPEVFDIIVTNIGGSQGTIENFTKTGDSLQIIAFVEDKALESASADLSKFIIGAANVSADLCLNTGENEWQCFWTTAPVNMQGFIDDNIVFTFTDAAGNSIQKEKQIKVYGLFENLERNLLNSTVSCSPRLIDRQTTALISQRVFCHVALKPVQENIQPLTIDLGECSGNTEAVENFELFNAELSKDPFIKLNLKQTEFRVNNITLVCPLGITSRVGNEITKAPEVENIPIKLEFYNLPIGELSENLQKDIDDAVEDATQTLSKTIGTLKKIEFFSRKICQVLNIFSNIVVTYHLITQTLAGIPPAAPLRVGSCVATEVQKASQNFQWLTQNKFCKLATCRQSPWGDLRDPIVDEPLKDVKKWTSWTEKGKLGDYWFTAGMGTQILQYTGKSPIEYMNPKDSLVVALLTVCLPGIVHGLDKYRQIQCMYASCLKEGVGKQGLPKTACDDQKSYAECKYVVGEIFNLIPYVMLFNFYVGLIKNTLSDPFSIIGVAVGLGCEKLCPSATEGPHAACITAKIFSMLGETAQDVKSMIDEGFEIREDFCSRLETKEKKKEAEEE